VANRALEIDGLTKRYGDVVALHDLSFDVRSGEVFGFVGRNGAGKTTTMRIVLGVLDADAGEVRWAGVPLTFSARRRIGYMPEERGLYPKMRVAEQLAYLAELHGMRAPAAQSAAGTWLDRFGLAERAGDELQKLSLSNQQRVQLVVLSLLPPFAPVLMPVRMATGDAPAWQLISALALTLATAGVLTWLAGRIYANSVLRLGARVRVLDALFGK
jgi:ABC-2 type transport system ATP-binding protein